MPFAHASGIRCVIHKNYFLTCEDYEALWERSGGTCELCMRSPGRRGLVIDHDHRYGEAAVRGLVCTRCNLYLGAFDKLMKIGATGRQYPGDWFRPYMRRAWFARHQQVGQLPKPVRANHEAIRVDMAYYRKARRAATQVDADAILLTLGDPTEIAQILRDRMSPQGFAALVRILVKMRETPKRLPPQRFP